MSIVEVFLLNNKLTFLRGLHVRGIVHPPLETHALAAGLLSGKLRGEHAPIPFILNGLPCFLVRREHRFRKKVIYI